MEDIGPVLVPILVVTFLIVLNGAFVATEFALARVRKTKIEDIAEGKDPEYHGISVIQAKQVRKMLDHINDYISTCQIGITVASLILGAYAEAKFVLLLEPVMEHLPLPVDPHVVAITIALSLITCLHVVLGEVVPKSMALAKPEDVSLGFAYFISPIQSVLQFPVWLLNQTSNNILKMVKIDPVIGEVAHSEDEIKRILSTSQEEGILEQDEEEMIQSIFEFNDTVAREIMTPRTDMYCLDETLTVEQAIPKVHEAGYSRYPIYKERLDNITGYIIIKDLFAAFSEGKNSLKIKTLAKTAITVPDGTLCIHLMKELQRKKKQMAILIDEFGGTSGLVTIEDIVEEIFGEIQDENEPSLEPVIELSNGQFIIDGLVTLEDVNDEVGSNFESEHYDTVGGFVFGLVGPHPKRGDKLDYEGYTLYVEKHDKQRVRTVRILPPELGYDAESSKTED